MEATINNSVSRDLIWNWIQSWDMGSKKWLADQLAFDLKEHSKGHSNVGQRKKIELSAKVAGVKGIFGDVSEEDIADDERMAYILGK